MFTEYMKASSGNGKGKRRIALVLLRKVKSSRKVSSALNSMGMVIAPFLKTCSGIRQNSDWRVQILVPRLRLGTRMQRYRCPVGEGWGGGEVREKLHSGPHPNPLP